MGLSKFLLHRPVKQLISPLDRIKIILVPVHLPARNGKCVIGHHRRRIITSKGVATQDDIYGIRSSDPNQV